MFGFDLGNRSGEELVRLIRALGQHRYVSSRLHLVHAFAIEAAGAHPALEEAMTWAAHTLSSRSGIELDSKDERLHRRVSDAELTAVLETLWANDDRAENAKKRLRERLTSIGISADDSRLPFDETREDDIFPVLVDAGWELLPLAQLDAQRHKGAIEAFDDFEVARFEEDSAIPPVVTIHELPLIGAVELLAAFDRDGRSRASFVLWQQGNPTYLDYVRRGILRAARIEVHDT